MTYQIRNDFTVTRQDGTYTGATNELVVSNGGTVTLPTPAAGEKFGIRALKNDVTVVENGAIEGSTSDREVSADGVSVFISDGSEWYLVSGNEYFGYDIPDSALTENLVAWYRFEDGNARDYASSAEFPDVTWGDSTAHDGSINGATYESSGGITDFESGGSSGYFEFVSDNIDIQSVPEFTPSDGFSLCVWVRDNGTALDDGFGNRILNNRDANNNFTTLDAKFGEGSDYQYSIKDSSTAAGLSSPLLSGWNHVVVTTSSNEVSLYVNGSLKDNESHNVTGTIQNSGWFIGNFEQYGGDKTEFYGDLDDIRFYNKPLVESEVSDIYNATKP